ncbi:MAG: ABC-2 family transporter protein [Candidatus Levyibacteriota bacterium]|nr:MAG: ABC-2 family transporter protein [Candidatus Levybacteria bacterium]
MEIKRYFRLWLLFTRLTTMVAFQSRFGAIVFLFGKLLRFLFFLLFIVVLVSKTQTLVGYSIWQIVFFFATFNLIDTIPQLLWREVYRFRSYVVSGFFDYIITKPISPLFRSLFGGSDILDIVMLIISFIFIFFSAAKLEILTLMGIISFCALVLNAMVISLALHIFVLSIGILTTEIDNAIMLYRDLTQMGRLPIDVYAQPLRGFLTFIIPVGIMITFPAKAIMGLLSWQMLIFSFAAGLTFFILSLFCWNFALKHYASVSS